MNNLPRVICEVEWPGLKPVTYWLQVRHPNHYATMAQKTDRMLNHNIISDIKVVVEQRKEKT